MNKSLTIGTFMGIPLRLHWSFALMILLVAYQSIKNNMTTIETIWFSGIMVAVFVCVVLHEYGHAYAAKKFGVKTQDIILSPLGGVARLESMPEKPIQELIIAIAGPLVNVVIAILLSLIIFLLGEHSIVPQLSDELIIANSLDFTKLIILLNIGLFLFNLIPAFPMDGGRILRALLAMKFGRLNATKFATIVGRIFAIGFILFGVYNDMYVQAMIGVFIYFMAGAEANSVRITEAFGNSKVFDVMRSSFTKLHLSDLISTPANLYQRNMESNFLVFDSLGYVAGVIPSLFLREYLQNKIEDQPVMNTLSKAYGFVAKEMPIQTAFELLNSKGLAMLLIKEGEEIIGVIDREGIYRFLEINKL